MRYAISSKAHFGGLFFGRKNTSRWKDRQVHA
ncbi:hypothetical protein ALQ43_200261 [Pseudomonas savastanoi pv. glycinea]|nr:hypothetical protein ALQ43_200261 [Pseudomonas savastanoi pv. glycinea]